VISVVYAPRRTVPCGVSAGTHTSAGTVVIAVRTASVTSNPTL
jgi:hypothetical protein